MLFFLLSGIQGGMFSPAGFLSSGTALSENHIMCEIVSPSVPIFQTKKHVVVARGRPQLAVSCSPPSLHSAILLLVDHGLII